MRYMVTRLLIIIAVAAIFFFMFHAWEEGADAVELLDRVKELFSR